jgi:hypothetical protein
MKQMVCGIMRDLSAEQTAYRLKEMGIAAAAVALRNAEILRTCARFELASDEFLSREQKACGILTACNGLNIKGRR